MRALLRFIGGIERFSWRSLYQTVSFENGSPFCAKVRFTLHDGSVGGDEQCVVWRDKLESSSGGKTFLEHLLQRRIRVGLSGRESFCEVSVEPVVDWQRGDKPGTVYGGFERQKRD